jgi:hypothetical protein
MSLTRGQHHTLETPSSLQENIEMLLDPQNQAPDTALQAQAIGTLPGDLELNDAPALPEGDEVELRNPS